MSDDTLGLAFIAILLFVLWVLFGKNESPEQQAKLPLPQAIDSIYERMEATLEKVVKEIEQEKQPTH